MSSNEYKLITEQVGVLGGIVMLVGTAIGMGFFIVPTQMMAVAGPSITIAILISIVPMIFAVLGLLQLGGAIPVAGGAYVYSSRLMGPYFGTLGATIPILAIWSYLLFAALGFAEYLHFFALEFALVPSVPKLAIVWAILLVFILINYLGIQFVAKVQFAMVFALLLGLVTFIVFGVPEVSTSNFTPLFPADKPNAPFANGYTPFLLAVVTLYIPFQGFTIIIEIGEELKNPIQNIPRVLGIGMAIVTFVSLAVVFVLAGIVTWEEASEIVETGGGLASALNTAAPSGVATVVAIGALVGAATTINTLFTSYSRTIMRAGRDDILPRLLANVHDDNNTPYNAIFLLGLPPLFFAPIALSLDARVAVDVLDWLVVVVVTGIFISFAFLGVGLWRLPTLFPNRYEHSFYKLPKPLLKIVAVGNTVLSLLLASLVGLSQPSALTLILAWMGLTYIFYRYRMYAHTGGSDELKENMNTLDSHE